MLSKIRRFLEITGIDSIEKAAEVAAAYGGIVLLGFIAVAFMLMWMRRPFVEGARIRHRLPIMAAASLMVIIASAAIGLGIVFPLVQASLRIAETSRPVNSMDRPVNSMAKIQSEQLVQTILSQPRYRDPKKLNRFEFKMWSQNGEDGIIAEIFRRIGTTNRYFVEFGASSGDENNTAFLLRLGWKGLWMDGDAAAVNRARATFRSEISSGKLTVIEAFITAENIEDLFRQGQVPDELDLLSIDIDRNDYSMPRQGAKKSGVPPRIPRVPSRLAGRCDYYVWEKIAHHSPRCVVIEYNAGFPPTMSWVVPYDPKAWGWNTFGNGNGASLKALEELGAKKGYNLVGCDLCGVNAFFVRNDLLKDRFAAPYTAENHYEPFRFGEILDHSYEKSSLEP